MLEQTAAHVMKDTSGQTFYFCLKEGVFCNKQDMLGLAYAKKERNTLM